MAVSSPYTLSKPAAGSDTGHGLPLWISADAMADRLAAAQAVAAERGQALLLAPASIWGGDSMLAVQRSLQLAARLCQALLAIDARETDVVTPGAWRELLDSAAPLLVLAPPGCSAAKALAESPHQRLPLRAPDALARRQLWQQALQAHGLQLPEDLNEEALQQLADRHVLTAARISAVVAVASAALQPGSGQAGSGQAGSGQAGAPALHAALDQEAAARANEVLAGLATRVERAHRWEHLVLAQNTARQLHEIADAIRHREQVYRQWGMQQRTGRSAGLMMLFCGASGTGKTMAASVVSAAAGLPLYRIDLASVVSKYIGETEQNLDRIFRAAQHASAVLLFDEADALLGRRSDVKDAHDRYANLEVAYLLQKMEEHDGVVILASNLPKNLDSAFARRMHYTVEFGRPNAPLRERLWRGIFPSTVPLADDIDYAFLAERFDTTGGEVQAVALDAAFLAAAEGDLLTMQHLMQAMSRRQTQQGNAGGMGRYREHTGAQQARPGSASLG